MKRISIILIFLLLFNITVISTVDITDAKPDTEYIKSQETFTVDKTYLENVIKELSSSSYRGRLPGTDGNDLAVKYLQNQYELLNLTSPKYLYNYLQPFTQKVIHHGNVPILHTIDNKGEVVGDYRYLTDFILRSNWLGTSISGEVNGELVLIEKREDFYQKSLHKKILLISNDLVDEFRNNSPREADGLIRYILSLNKNIKAVIIQNDIRRNGYFHISTALTSQIRQLGYNKALSSKIISSNNTGPMVMYCSDFAYETLYISASENQNARIKAEKELVDTKSANVIGLIEGTNPSNEYIIIGAHLDHLGGYDNGPYYPGALDNATGIAAMLEIARIMSEMERPEKTIVFTAFNGEEVYLAGSQFYTQKPIFPLASSTMINLDIVGTKGSDVIDISGYFRQTNSTQQILNRYSSYIGIDTRISRIASSDHVHFAANGVQSVMLTTVESSPITHTIKDSFTKSVDLEVLEKVIKLVVYYLQNQAY